MEFGSPIKTESEGHRCSVSRPFFAGRVEEERFEFFEENSLRIDEGKPFGSDYDPAFENAQLTVKKCRLPIKRSCRVQELCFKAS